MSPTKLKLDVKMRPGIRVQLRTLFKRAREPIISRKNFWGWGSPGVPVKFRVNELIPLREQESLPGPFYSFPNKLKLWSEVQREVRSDARAIFTRSQEY